MMSMKTKYIFVFAVVAAVLSCQKQEKVFDESSSARMEKFLDNVQSVISESQNGWYMTYYTKHEDVIGPGSIYTIQFDKPASGKATIFHEEVKPAEGWGDSCNYKLTRDDGPVLTFDTYNAVMHYFATSSGEYYQSRGGDFEFDILSACADSVVLRGKRTHNYYKMYPLAEEANAYIEKVQTMAQSLTIGLVEAEITGGLIEMEIDLARRVVAIGRKDADDDEIVEVPFVITPTGFKLYETLDFQGVKFKDFVFDEDAMSLTSNGITFNMVVPEGYMPYSKFLGKYTLKNALGTREVSLVEKVKGRSFNLHGLNANYDVEVTYNAGQGSLYVYVQQIGSNAQNGHQYWLTVSDGNQFTWSTSAAAKTEVDDPEKNDFTLSFVDAGLYSSFAVSSFWLAEFSGAPSSDSYIKGGITVNSWKFFEKDPEMEFPVTLTKIVEE